MENLSRKIYQKSNFFNSLLINNNKLYFRPKIYNFKKLYIIYNDEQK